MASLGAYLDDTLIALGRIHHGPSLNDGFARRFFYVHVLTGGTGIDHHQGMPMVWGSDDDRIDVLLIEKLSVVLE